MAGDKVVSLFGFVPKGQVHPGVIAKLERALEMAKNGEVDGIAIALSQPNDHVRALFDFGGSSFRLFGALAHLEVEMKDSMQEGKVHDE